MRPSFDAYFPQRYERAVWATGAALTAGFIALEAALHARPYESAAAWDAVCAVGYLVYLVPLALAAVKVEAGALRRLLFGYFVLLLAGAGAAMLPIERVGLEAGPCLQIAGMTLVVIFCARRGQRAAAFGAAALLAATTTAMAVAGRHAFVDFVAGAAMGGLAAAFADWSDLSFLKEADPWAALRHELGELRNLVGGNRRETWDDSFAGGHWDFLDSRDQRPRHYAIAGLLAECLPREGARVMDAGCGLATLYPLLRGRVAEYVGLDVSAEALKKASAAYGAEAGVRFAHQPFEDFCEDGFDAVVLNEVLYYYPLAEATQMFTHALGRLRPGGVLVVSMNRNLKARLIWRRLARAAPAELGMRVHNLRTGSYWVIKVFRHSAKSELNV